MADVVSVRGVLHAHLERARVGVLDLVGGLVLAAHARHLIALVAAAPVLIDVIRADDQFRGLVGDAHGQLARQHQLEVRRVALDDGVVEVADVEPLGHLRIQVPAEIVGGAERQQAFLVLDRPPLHSDLSLDARNAVIVRSHRRGKVSFARDRRRGHHERAVDVAPVILGGHADREVLEDLPADAQLDLRHVALALIVVLDVTHVAVHGVRRIVLVIVLGPVPHRTVRRQAETQPQFPGQRHLKGDVVEVERIVGRVLGLSGDFLRIVVVLSLQPEVEEEGLLLGRAVSRGIEQVERPRRTHGHTRTAHRAHRQRTGCVLFADAVHRIGRECVNTACLGCDGSRDHRHGRDNQFNQGVLHLHYTLIFYPIRKRRDYNLQISCF